MRCSRRARRWAGGVLLCLLALAAPAQAADCRDEDRRAGLADLASAETFARSHGTIALEGPALNEARQSLQMCSIAELVRARMAVVRVYARSEATSLVEASLTAACELAGRIAEDPRREIQFNCRAARLSVWIELDRYEEAIRESNALR